MCAARAATKRRAAAPALGEATRRRDHGTTTHAQKAANGRGRGRAAPLALAAVLESVSAEVVHAREVVAGAILVVVAVVIAVVVGRRRHQVDDRRACDARHRRRDRPRCDRATDRHAEPPRRSRRAPTAACSSRGASSTAAHSRAASRRRPRALRVARLTSHLFQK